MCAADLAGEPDVERLAHHAGARQRLDGAGTRQVAQMLKCCLASPLLERVRRCRLAGGRVWRELPYVRPLGPERGEFEQGKIDLLFEEDGAWVLVDYKTDRLPPGAEPAPYFTDRYAGQIRAYADALNSLGVTLKSACLLLARTGDHIELPV
jgi:ATP-dependent helicase/nuclease subunit A